MMTESQLRFLREIGARVGADRIHEVRLFPTIRQGGVESGVAIVAARPLDPLPPAITILTDIETPIPVVQELDAESPYPTTVDGPQRFEILSARYKLVLKGTERGTWDLELHHEADAPLDTIDRVVRGVALRAGEGGEPECIAVAAWRDALGEIPVVSENELGAEYGTK